MWFSRKQATRDATQGDEVIGPLPRPATTKAAGDQAEDLALAHLQAAGLALVQRNFKTPGRGGGEIDLIMREPDGTLVFVEVRSRGSQAHGGAAASIGAVKQRRIVLAARHFLQRMGSEPPCRFDVVLIQRPYERAADAGQAVAVEWLRGAFDTSAAF